MNTPSLKAGLILCAIILALGAASGGFSMYAWHNAHLVTETRTLIQ